MTELPSPASHLRKLTSLPYPGEALPMPDSLCDLVEREAARRGRVPREIWAWALKAIYEGSLRPKLPEGVTLDALRPVLADTLTGVTTHRFDPAKSAWTGRLIMDATMFRDRLNAILSDATAPRRPGGKSTKREATAAYVRSHFPDGVIPPGVKLSSVVADMAKERIVVSERTLRRALGRK